MSLFASCFKENCSPREVFFFFFCENNKQFQAQYAFSLPHQDAVGQNIHSHFFLLHMKLFCLNSTEHKSPGTTTGSQLTILASGKLSDLSVVTEAGDSEQACTISLRLLCRRSSQGRICLGYFSSTLFMMQGLSQSGCSLLLTSCLPLLWGKNSSHLLVKTMEWKRTCHGLFFENLAVFLGHTRTECSYLIVQHKQYQLLFLTTINLLNYFPNCHFINPPLFRTSFLCQAKPD